MAHLSPQKRKKRRVQLREAQRRRRARLKDEAKSFLQIILDQETLNSLRVYSDSQGKPLHTCAADLIRGGLIPAPAATAIIGTGEDARAVEVENLASFQKERPGELEANLRSKPKNQMEFLIE
jgi:hypothetical protein